MAQQPQTMRAWQTVRNGSPKDALVLNPDVAAPPQPTGGDILVRISHAALNPADLEFIHGLPVWLPFRRRPIPAMDFAGEVVAAGPAVPARLGIGTHVCGAVGIRYVAVGHGSLAEYVLLPAHLVAVRPAALEAGPAAGLMGIAGQTAALMLETAKVKPGTRALVNGASGGVGSVLVQALKGMGAVVTGVCSGRNEAMVRTLGADEVIDYTQHESLYAHLAETLRDDQLDVIFDCMGDNALFQHSPAYLKPDGRLINIVGSAAGLFPIVKNMLLPTILGGVPRAYHLLLLLPSGRTAQMVAGWVEDGLVKGIPVDSTYKMADAVQGYEKLLTKRAKGKIVIEVQA